MLSARGSAAASVLGADGEAPVAASSGGGAIKATSARSTGRARSRGDASVADPARAARWRWGRGGALMRTAEGRIRAAPGASVSVAPPLLSSEARSLEKEDIPMQRNRQLAVSAAIFLL